MTLHLKPAIIIIATLLLGILFGVVISNTLARQQGEKLRALTEPDPFVSFHFRIVDPTDDQQEQLQPIIRKYHNRLLEVRETHFRETSTILDEMYRDLATVLSEEQMEKLREGVGPYRVRIRRPEDGRRMLSPERMGGDTIPGSRLLFGFRHDVDGSMKDGFVYQRISRLFAAINADLNVNDDQRQHLNRLRDEVQKKIQPLEYEIAEKMLELDEEHIAILKYVDEELVKILTDEQYDRYRKDFPLKQQNIY
jgi:hypothetical protein